MSETTTPAPEQDIYPSFSEASENDVREAAPAPVEAEEAAPATETPPPEIAAVAAPEAEETDDDLKARNSRLARTLREEKRRARNLELEAMALRGQRTEQPNEAMQREITQRAAEMAQQVQVNQRANEIYQDGIKEFGRVEFDESVKAVNEAFGAQIMPVVIDTLIDLDAPQKLLHFLADNPDIADQLAALPPHKLGAALAREAAKISAPKQRPVSKAPPPIRPISTQSTSEPELDMEKMSMEQLAAMWDKRDFEKRFR